MIVGGVDMMTQAIALARKPHIVIATPGRIVDHRHHPADVVAGLLLGGVGALLFFARSLAGRLALPRYDAKARAPVFESGGGEGAGLTEARV